ncbi:sugar kinase [Actinokineospora xionganensis]|uniref:Sugar kinase n=1 Tax=Actinokineospora xionganensis TaxID=2684470 RepID=A0ABR7L3P8_9PSEU|nr:sugar kinase [Actinokineospora xionganensis]MBC6447313.1 sugar kinase [Actinokineospora xionganensis]
MDVVTFGEIMGLMVAHPGDPLRHAHDFRRGIAGAEATVAIGLSRLGYRTGWFGRLGDDPFGHAALEVLRASGVDVSRVELDADAPTGLLVRDAHAVRRISVQYYRSGSAASLMRPAELDPTYIAGARLLHVTGITPALSQSCLDTVRAAIELAHEHGVVVSFDPNLRLRLWSAERAAAVLGELVVGADIVLTSDEEALVVTGQSDRSSAAKWLLDRGTRVVVVKAGAAGAWAADGVDEWAVPAFPAVVVDPVGAGDAFDTGFLSGWLDGAPVADCLARGAAAGSLAVQSVGDVDGLPYPADLAAVLAADVEVDR